MLTVLTERLPGREIEARHMPTSRITKRAVDALQCPPGKDRVFLWDDAIAGFGVAAFPSGKKVYVAQYRLAGRSRRAAIGEHGRLTPDEARTEAKKLLGAVAQGSDPIAQRKTARAVPLFRDVADEFMREHVAAKRKRRTFDAYRTLLAKHILPAIGSMRVMDIRRRDISKFHAAKAATPGAANRALTVISSIWNWAANEHNDLLLPPNPAKGVVRNPEKACERFLTTNELARLGDALREGETIGLPYAIDETNPKAKHAPKAENRRVKLDPFAVAAIRLLMLTGARLREILHAKWENVDFERSILFLPDSKTGRKPVYLSAAALDVLSSLPRIAGNPHIIAGAKDGAPRADLKKPWAALRRVAGLEGVRIHDLRHSFASVGAGASLGLPIIGKLLGHKQAATTHRYAHLDADPMKRAADAIGSTINAAMNRKPSADVVPLKGTKAAG
jgi:integrase